MPSGCTANIKMRGPLKTALFSLLLLVGSACQPDREIAPYFPLPERQLEVIHSDAQSFMVDTLLADLNRPWSMEFLPDGRMLITEREGNLLLFEKGVPRGPLRGDVPAGLREVKLHPQYEKNGLIYISWYIDPTDDEGAYTVLGRGRIQGDRFVDLEELYRAGPFFERGSTFGSRIEFDREGYLYFLVGGRTLDERHRRINIQMLDNPSGKTMRLYDDGRIPEDNPFVDVPGALPEIFSYGQRQHQGVMLHPVTGEIWSTEHGEMGGDELNIVRAGKNYGWPLATYSLEYDSTSISDDPLLEGTEPPIHYWTPSISPPSLDIVRGDRYPGWKGDLMVGSLSQMLLNRTIMDDTRPVGDEHLLPGIGRVRKVKSAPDGYIYFLTEDNGMLVRLLPAE